MPIIGYLHNMLTLITQSEPNQKVTILYEHRKSNDEDIVEYLVTILFEQVSDVSQSFFELREPHCNAVH